MPVSAGAVDRRDLRVIQPALGTILALNTAVVRARVEGELRAIHFTEGQQVRAGQLLAEIDPRPYEVQLAQAEGQLARDQAQLANAQIDLARYRDLAARDSIARQQVDTQEALVKQLGGTIRINQAAVDNARLLLSYTRVTAPISGQVGLRQVDLGNVVRASDPQGLITITQTQPISVIFSLPEAALPRLRAGMRGAERPTVEVWDRDGRTRLAMGAVSSLDNAIDPATGTIRVKAQFDNRDGALYPNQFVNIRLHLDTLAGATVVPSNAVQRGATGSFVYRIGDSGAVSVRPIEVLAVEGDWTGVRGDLAPGDRVVTDGADRLREGAQVEVIAPARGRPGAAPTPGMPPTSTAGVPPAERPPWLDRLPPEQQERFMKMSPDERQTFIEQMRERRRQQQGG
jgi:multidrug efflux system membrane fusion protein